MRIALFQNNKNVACLDAFHRTKTHLVTKDVDVVSIEPDEELSLKQINSFDVAISFGGDGAFLHVLHRLGKTPPPMVGVNLGSLGFLAEIQILTLEQSLDEICTGTCNISERIMLECQDSKKHSYLAVNEIAFHRESTSNLIDIEVRVDKEYVNTFSSDGLIIATPCGSTAYSLSAGGPIVCPTLQAVVLTPICPHTISNRPIVLCPHSSIEVSLTRGAERAGVAVDGLHAGTLDFNKKWTVTLSAHRFKMLTFSSFNYFQTLRHKLGWSGSLRKENS